MRPVLYYVHHHGHGHWRRALAVASYLQRPVLLASSAPPPWPLPPNATHVPLPLDAPAPPGAEAPAGGRLHWAPLDHHGLMDRNLAVLAECAQHRPAAAVVDVSVEMVVLLRASGIPVLTVRQPGERGDPAHRLGYDLSVGSVMPVPSSWALHDELDRTCAVGLVGRSPSLPVPQRAGEAHAVVLLGSGGSDLDADRCAQIARDLPQWRVTVLGRDTQNGQGEKGGGWPPNLCHVGHREDPVPLLANARVVIGNAGLGTVCDVASARRPFVVVPATRPFGEQEATAEALIEHGHAVTVGPQGTPRRWREAVHAATALGPLTLPVDGARRFAALVEELASRECGAGTAEAFDRAWARVA